MNLSQSTLTEAGWADAARVATMPLVQSMVAAFGLVCAVTLSEHRFKIGIPYRGGKLWENPPESTDRVLVWNLRERFFAGCGSLHAPMRHRTQDRFASDMEAALCIVLGHCFLQGQLSGAGRDFRSRKALRLRGWQIHRIPARRRLLLRREGALQTQNDKTRSPVAHRQPGSSLRARSLPH